MRKTYWIRRPRYSLPAKLEELEQRIQGEGVSADDHTRYTDLLEWRAIDEELSQLRHILEML